MLSPRRKLSPRHKYWLGFLWCPLVSWAAFAGQFVIPVLLVIAFPYLRHHMAPALQVFLWVSWVVCWIGVALFCGFGASYFWDEFASNELDTVLCSLLSVALGGAPTLLFVAKVSLDVMVLLFVPVMVFFFLYEVGLKRGLKFWDSNSPREWVGDFSNPDGDS